MDIESVEKKLSDIVERRARQRETANAEFAAWHEPAKRRRARARKQNRAEWAAYY